MKKIIALALSFFCLQSVHALPIGSPADPSLYCNGVFFCNPYTCFSYPWCDRVSLRIGYYGDFVFDRHMETDAGGGINRTKIHTNAGFLALNIMNRVDIFSTLGATNIFLTSFSSTLGGSSDPNDRSEIKTETDFSWSIGLRTVLFEWNCFTFGIEGQYFRSEPKINYFFEEDAAIPVYFDDLPIKYHEWQVGGAISYRIPFNFCSTTWFLPYIGVKWSRAKFEIDNIDVTIDENIIGRFFDFENEREWGWAIGFSIAGNSLWTFTMEGRFADERALYLNTQFRI